MKVTRILGVAAAVLANVASPDDALAAQRGSDEARAKTSTAAARHSGGRAAVHEAATEFAVGNVEYLLVHEIAHLLIAEKGIPIVGPVENAADYLATLALIREEPLDPAHRERARRFLLAAAEAFGEAWRAGNELGADVPYWGAHALSIQRYYQITCLLYGSDPDGLVQLPASGAIPPPRARECVAEYTRAERAIEWLLTSYGRQPGDAEGAATRVVYGDPPTTVSSEILREIQAIELLERVAARLHTRFTLERPFDLVLRSCRRAEAAWQPDARELVICYELLDTLYLLGRSVAERK